MEYEYRYSEIVRLNPRNCWYWLAGSCVNSTCVFRHLLEIFMEKLDETMQKSGSGPIVGGKNKRLKIIVQMKGNFVISTTHVSSVLINPIFQKAKEMQNWHDSLKAQNKDVTLMPTKLIRGAREVKIKDIINGCTTMKDSYCRFSA